MEFFLAFFSDVLLILVMILVAKTIYNDSIKIDKVAGILILIMEILEAFYLLFEKKLGSIGDLIIEIEMILLVVIFLRGGKRQNKAFRSAGSSVCVLRNVDNAIFISSFADD